VTPASPLNSLRNPIWDFITFRLMITPLLIQFVFWIGTLACFGFGTRLIVASFDSGASDRKKDDKESDRIELNSEKVKKSDFSAMMLAEGVLIVIVGPLLLRIACELDIILFKMNDELKEANDRTRYQVETRTIHLPHPPGGT